ncbi:MAG TPA: SMP-30/gluconolactonase/LRE family protein [Burkholderiales bacterium]|nr:SMP-30/gluconolactonase/LRE family protein [Burkholderiales bacterium]
MAKRARRNATAGEPFGIRGDFEIHDERFRMLVPSNGWVEKLFTGALWAEGPAYFADTDTLLFSDIPNNRILRWVPDGTGVGTITEYRKPSNNSNGNTRDREGRLVTCEHGARRVTRTELDGRITVLADRFKNKRLNSPNDVVVKSDGSVWFTDPSYGILSDYEGHRGEREYGGSFVFRLDPATQKLDVVADDFVQPNGLAFSPDEEKLYVNDTGASHDPSGPHHVRVFKVNGKTGTLQGGNVFATINPGVPDGLRVDTDGNVWISAGDGVHCYAPNGKILGKVKVPEPVANLVFGGPKRNRLFITATSSLYACYVTAAGAQRP